MNTTRLIGDIHGKIYDYQSYSIGDFKGPSIQVGDFGVGFAGDYWHDNVAAWQEANPQHRFIRGNHDDPTRCKLMPGYINDGHVENDVMFIGGAWSIDYARRREGFDWWRDEELSIEQLNRMYDIYVTIQPRVMITHDAPTDVTYEMFVQTGLAIGGSNAKKINTRTGQAFQAMFEAHQPDFHFFGHWHHSMACQYGRTTFVCLGELDYIDVDLEDSDQIHEAITSKFS